MKSAAFFLVVFTIGIITVFSANLIHDEKVRLFDIPTNSPILIEALTNVEPQMNVHLNSTKQYRWNVQKAVLWSMLYKQKFFVELNMIAHHGNVPLFGGFLQCNATINVLERTYNLTSFVCINSYPLC